MYNKHEIMVNAWRIRRSAHVPMSTALKAAWALAKAIKTAEQVAADIDWNTKIHVNDWAKSGHNRTYVEVAVYTNGYVNNLTGAFVAA